MPTLTRKIIDVKLPSFGNENPVNVKVFDGIVAGDYDDMPEFDKPRMTFYWILSQVIQEWDLKDDAGQPLPIIPENVRLMKINDITAIRQAIGMENQLDDAKKNS